MSDNGKKEIGTKWLEFLYVLFIIQCVIMSLSILTNITSIIRYKNIYGSTYGLDGSVYLLIVFDIIRLIVKIATVKNKHENSGYSLILTTLVLDAIAAVYNGFTYNATVGTITILLMAAIFIPNFIYVTKRKSLYFVDYYSIINKHSQNGKNSVAYYKCTECGKIGPYESTCSVCGSTTRVLYEATEPDDHSTGLTDDSDSTEASSKTDKCDFCGNVGGITPCVIKDSYGTRYRNLCYNCIIKNKANPIDGSKPSKSSSCDNIESKDNIAVLCKQCGAELPEGYIYCNKCGTKAE